MSLSIPDTWEFLLLALGAYRLTRLVGWDQFPLAEKVRAWVTGETWVPLTESDLEDGEPPAGAVKTEGTGRIDAAELGLPGKKPVSLVGYVRVAYHRPTIAHLVTCPFCIGWWISLTVYIAWLAAPRPTLYAMTPLALSAAVGLIAKNLDP